MKSASFSSAMVKSATFGLAFVLTSHLSADLFYTPGEYQNIYDDRYAYQLELKIVKEDAAKTIAALNSEIRKLRGDIDTASRAATQFRMDKTAEVDGLQAKLDACLAQAEQARLQNEKDIQNLERKIKILREQSNHRERELIDSHKKAEEQLREALADLTRKMETAQAASSAQIAQLTKNLEEYKRLVAEQAEKLKNLENQAQELESKLKKEIAEGSLRIKRQNGKIIINMDDKILFDSGSATLKSGINDTLGKIAKILSSNAKNQIIIEGHTDNVPINTPRFRNNWQLSAERALAVLAGILRNIEIDQARFSMAAFAEFNPVAPNDTPQNRQLNRRVDIVIMP
jgi:chemotaxis protein MotB